MNYALFQPNMLGNWNIAFQELIMMRNGDSKDAIPLLKTLFLVVWKALTRESSHKSYTDAQQEAKNLISSSLNAQNIIVEGING
jgi:hypothetical protein